MKSMWGSEQVYGTYSVRASLFVSNSGDKVQLNTMLPFLGNAVWLQRCQPELTQSLPNKLPLPDSINHCGSRLNFHQSCMSVLHQKRELLFWMIVCQPAPCFVFVYENNWNIVHTGPKGTDPSGLVWWPRQHFPEGVLCAKPGSEGHWDVERQPLGLQQQPSCPAAECRHVECPHSTPLMPTSIVLRDLLFPSVPQLFVAKSI